MKPNYQRKRGLLRIAAIGQVLVMGGAGCKSSAPKDPVGKNEISVSQALVGKDLSLTVTAANTVVNGYAALNADAAAGATSVQVANVASFAAGGIHPALAVGDLVLIIQMGGATINTTDSVDYGTVSALNNAGRYEFAGVASITSNTIGLSCGLKNSYTAAGKTQVVRVPQYTNLTINSGASITADAWNGTVGGVAAVHAMNTVTLTGSIDVTGKGFRGGVTHAGSNATDDVTIYRSTDGNQGAMKGEGIAGDPSDVSFTQKYGRGAPANAGGGGNLHNAGGGGGANASADGTWTGQGVMLSTVTGAGAWTLDPSAGANSPGGGRGGYSWSNNAGNALSLAPGNASWGGNNRRERGGLGGRPLASSTGGTGARLFMGGGGGAGDGNNGVTGAGGPGGGMVFLIAGTVAGAGRINADGAIGGEARTNGNGDAAGGGGGGGTVVVHAGLLSGITVTANGGVGGNQVFTQASPGDEGEGPGGGGGGGFVALYAASGAPASVTAAGALGGTTNSGALTEFPTNGATAGRAGVSDASAAVLMYCTDDVAPHAIIVTKPSNPSTSGSGTFTFGAVEQGPGAAAIDAGDSAANFECSLDKGPFTACPPTYIVSGLSDGWHTMDVRVVDLSGNDAGVGGQDTYRWRVDLVAPIPRILTGPGGTVSGGTSNSSSGHFTFTATEMDSGVETVTFLCRLDSNDANAFSACNADHTIAGPLTEGTHTLDVRAVDDSGNQTSAADTVRWTWTVHLLEAGADGPSDAADTAEADALVLADAADAEDGAAPVLPDASPDLSRDSNNVILDTAAKDTSISLGDAARDGADAETGLLDAKSDGSDATTIDGDAREAGSLDATLPKDTTVTPALDAAAPSPDTAVQPAGKKDAAAQEPVGAVKFMGGGFCSLSPAGHGAPGLATLFLLAAFGMLVRRRRR